MKGANITVQKREKIRCVRLKLFHSYLRVHCFDATQLLDFKYDFVDISIFDLLEVVSSCHQLQPSHSMSS